MKAARRIPIVQRPENEMTLQDALSDTLVQSVMAADHVDPGSLSAMLECVARSLESRTITGAQHAC